jgi:hypothetical protein
MCLKVSEFQLETVCCVNLALGAIFTTQLDHPGVSHTQYLQLECARQLLMPEMRLVDMKQS